MLAASKLLLTSVNAPPMHFVTRDAATGYLMLDGQRFRFAGNNGEFGGWSESTTTYGETAVGSLHLMSHAADNDYMYAAANMKSRVTRFFLTGLSAATTNFVSGLGTYDHTALEGVDYLIPQFKANGIRLIASLADDYDQYGDSRFQWCRLCGVSPDGTASQFYTDTTVVSYFKAFVSQLLNHTNVYTGIKYKDDPVFLAWESGNELTGGGNGGQDQLDWTVMLADHIKNTIGAQQLFMDGKWGLIGPGSVIPTAYMNNQLIDGYTEHSYDQWRTPAFFANVASIAHNYGKFFVVGEFPLYGLNNGSPPSGIGWNGDDMVAAMAANKNCDGSMMWSLHAQGNFHGGGFCTHYPGDDAGMIARVAAQKAHGIAMAGPTLTNATDHAKSATAVGPDVDAAQWTPRSTANISGGQIILPTGDTAYSTAVVKDFSDSSFIVEMPQKNPGGGASECGMYLQGSQAPRSNDFVGFTFGGGLIAARLVSGGSFSDVTATYNSSDHRWMRLRASKDATVFTAYPIATGSIFWDTSNDGVHWVPMRTATTNIVTTSVYLIVYNWNYGGDGGSGTAIFDNVNNPPAPVPTLYPPVKRPNYGSLVQV